MLVDKNAEDEFILVNFCNGDMFGTHLVAGCGLRLKLVQELYGLKAEGWRAPERTCHMRSHTKQLHCRLPCRLKSRKQEKVVHC